MKEFLTDYTNLVQLFNHSNDGLFVTNGNNQIIMANPAFLRMSGFEFSEIYLKDPSYFQSGKTPKHVYKSMWQTLCENGSWTGELINRKKDGELWYSYLTITEVKKEHSKNHYYIAFIRDITEKKEANEKIDYLAKHDTLTGLPNRSYYTDLTATFIERRANKTPFAIFFIDLDRFKLINDTLGHICGDYVLTEVGRRIVNIFGENAIVSRFGGDEFVVALPEGETEEIVRWYIHHFFHSLRNDPFVIHNKEYYLTASIGVSFYPVHGEDPLTLIQNADTAMYNSKDESKNNFHFYQPYMKVGVTNQLELDSELRKAIRESQFVLHYQLQMDTEANKPYGLEALIRWNHPTRGLLFPHEFIEEAAQLGLIQELDNWVLFHALMKMKKWHEQGLGDLLISVNVSSQQFMEENFVDTVKRVLLETEITPSLVCLEITENFALMHAEEALDKLMKLKELGVKIALDDFGTGYSSLNQLIHCPIDILKIDQSFVRNSNGRDKNAAIIESIIHLGKQLEFSLVCEGIETKEQMQYIRNRGCHVLQGYLFSKPLPVKEIGEKLLLSMETEGKPS